MRPEKKERVFDNEPYCKSCRRSENFCQCTGHNSCHDLHTEWFKSQEFKDKIAKMIWAGTYNAVVRESRIIASAISKYLAGE
ncbi:hypothetical protein LCGC14_1875120 [marine sediment metagenome]|uniref:Uncharacterized protein n=1 Tax=marine sediment metagenome TaxID=412755 RepID=A0A0F9G419_9ZZZZ